MQSDTIITLKPQDVVVLLKLITLGREPWTLTSLSKWLYMPISSVNQILQRAYVCNLYNNRRRIVHTQALEEFLIHGVRYAFPAVRGSIVRGIPTASAAPPLNRVMDAEALKWPPVWPDANGTEQGYAITPLYESVPQVVRERKDKPIYELLALVDALREGRARERKLSIDELSKKLHIYQKQIAKVS